MARIASKDEEGADPALERCLCDPGREYEVLFEVDE